MPERTVGELVAERPNLSRVFQAFDIGFCCQGNLTLAQACEKKGLPVEELLRAIEKELASRDVSEGEDPREWGVPQMIQHIVEFHHGYLRRELPRIHEMAERVARVHGPHTPSLIDLLQEFIEVATELGYHMKKEEMILFPAIESLDSGRSGLMHIDSPIECMMEEHEKTTQGIQRLRELTHDYTPPAEACNTYRALFAGLADLEVNTRRHIYLENEILFPSARKLCG